MIAGEVALDRHPFFAPVAAVVALNTALGGRGRQAVNLLNGTVVGILTGAATAWLLGSQTLALVAATPVAMVVAVGVGAARVTIAQAAAGAILIVTVPYGAERGPVRLMDAAIGVAVALVFSQLVFPTHPVRLVDRAERTVLERTHGLLAGVAASAGTQSSPAATRRALAATHAALSELDGARAAALNIVHHTVRGARWHRQTHVRVARTGTVEQVAATAARGQETLAALQDRADLLDAASVDAVTAVHLLLRTLGASPRTAGGTG